MKYKENEETDNVVITISEAEEVIKDTPSIKKTDLYSSICKMISTRIKILEESITDLKNMFSHLEDLYNERDD